MQRQHNTAKSDIVQVMTQQMEKLKHKQKGDQACLKAARAEVADRKLEVAALRSLLTSVQVRTKA